MIRKLLMSLAVFSVTSHALADDTTLTFSASTNTVPGAIDLMIGTAHVPVTIPAQTTAVNKRNLVRAALQGTGYSVTDNGPAGTSLTIQSLPSNAKVKLSTGTTGELTDKIVTPTPLHAGTVSFQGTFDPFDSHNQPAIFTAGIVTDVGLLTASVTSQQLNFQTDGPIVCQALFQRLAPRAPQYGAQIDYFGDRLEMWPLSNTSIVPGGVVFGTTSRSQGCYGGVELLTDMREMTLSVGPCTSPSSGPVHYNCGTADVMINVAAYSTADAKMSSCRSMFLANFMSVVDGPDAHSVRIKRIGIGDRPTFECLATGETDVMVAPSVVTGTAGFGFIGSANSLDSQSQPATFTCGIVTDLGTLSETISSQELNFQTDGPIICQALFQRLAPRAPQYGAQINYAGDRLEVYFDPAYTVAHGGIIFGTTSLTPGVYGSLGFRLPCVADVDDGTGRGIPDGGVGIEDLLFYLSLYNAGDPRADVDNGSGTGVHDGGVGIEDLLYYLVHYNSGC